MHDDTEFENQSADAVEGLVLFEETSTVAVTRFQIIRVLFSLSVFACLVMFV